MINCVVVIKEVERVKKNDSPSNGSCVIFRDFLTLAKWDSSACYTNSKSDL